MARRYEAAGGGYENQEDSKNEVRRVIIVALCSRSQPKKGAPQKKEGAEKGIHATKKADGSKAKKGGSKPKTGDKRKKDDEEEDEEEGAEDEEKEEVEDAEEPAEEAKDEEQDEEAAEDECVSSASFVTDPPGSRPRRRRVGRALAPADTRRARRPRARQRPKRRPRRSLAASLKRAARIKKSSTSSTVSSARASCALTRTEYVNMTADELKARHSVAWCQLISRRSGSLATTVRAPDGRAPRETARLSGTRVAARSSRSSRASASRHASCVTDCAAPTRTRSSTRPTNSRT